MKTNKNIIGICIIILVLSLNLAMAFSSLSSYSQENPLTVYPGEEKEAIIKIYPAPEEGTAMVEATIIEGMNIASIADTSNIYESPQTEGGTVYIKVKVPSNTPVGSEYLVVSRFVDKNPAPTTGTVGFNVETTNTFKVVVVEKPPVIEETPQGEGINLIWWIVGVIVVVALVIYFVVKRKK